METLHTVGSVASIIAVGMLAASWTTDFRRLLVGLIVACVIIMLVYLADTSFLRPVGRRHASGFCPCEAE